MNSCSFEFLDSRLRGNDEISVFDFLFLREWRFGSYLKFKKKKNGNRTDWIPACAGMTDFRFLYLKFLII